MTRKEWVLYSLSVVGGLCITGCVDKGFKMVGRECPQVTKYEPPYSLIKQYLQSVTLYEGYETRAHFDVLVMSDQMRALYAALHSAKVGHSDNEKAAFFTQQLDENRHNLTLYVLAQINDQSHVSLSDKNSAWSLFITTPRGARLTPTAIKEVELSPEIRSIFGHRYIPFKKPYQFTFAANNIAGKPYILPGDVCTVTFAAAGMHGRVEWRAQQLTAQEAGDDYLLKERGNEGILDSVRELSRSKERDGDIFF